MPCGKDWLITVLILVSFFSEGNVLSDEIKICYIFEFQSNENRAFRFFGTPGIVNHCSVSQITSLNLFDIMLITQCPVYVMFDVLIL